MFPPDLRDVDSWKEIETVSGFLICANGNMTVSQFPRGLKTIYEALECTGIEGVRLKDAIMYIDDEGKFKPNPKMNKLATIIAWLNGLDINDWIAGNAIIFGSVSPSGEIDGEDYNCPRCYQELFINFCEMSQEQIEEIVKSLRWGINEVHRRGMASGGATNPANAGAKKRRRK